MMQKYRDLKKMRIHFPVEQTEIKLKEVKS